METASIIHAIQGRKMSLEQRGDAMYELIGLRRIAKIGEELSNLLYGEDWADAFLRLIELKKKTRKEGLNEDEQNELDDLQIQLEEHAPYLFD